MTFARIFLMIAALVAAPAAAQTAASPLTAGTHEDVVNGVRLWYRVAGRTDGEPVVFLHGGPGQGSQTFARFAGPGLEKSLRMVYLDQRGSGRSERPWTKAYSFDLMVEDLEQLRRRWGVESMAIIGHSFGTALALEYAARHPQRVSRLVLAGALSDVPALIDLQCRRLKTLDPATYAKAVAARDAGSARACNPFAAGRAFIDGNMYPDPATAKIVDESDAADGLKNTGEIGAAFFGGGMLEYRFDRAAHLTMPLLVIGGEKDFQTMAAPARKLAADAPDGRYLEFPGDGHFMFVESPDKFARDVISFLTAGRGTAGNRR